MGMASSQARLLSLTRRQLDVELRAQVLQARKLQLESDSKKVYNNYMTALNESSIKYRFTNNMGESVTRDANLNGLQNGLVGAYGASDKVMFLQSIGGETLFVTPTVNNKYDLVGISEGRYPDMNNYIEQVLGTQAFKKVCTENAPTIFQSKVYDVMEIKNKGVDVRDVEFNSVYRTVSSLSEEVNQPYGYQILINDANDFIAYLNVFSENILDLIETDPNGAHNFIQNKVTFTDFDAVFGGAVDAETKEKLYDAIDNAAGILENDEYKEFFSEWFGDDVPPALSATTTIRVLDVNNDYDSSFVPAIAGVLIKDTTTHQNLKKLLYNSDCFKNSQGVLCPYYESPSIVWEQYESDTTHVISGSAYSDLVNGENVWAWAPGTETTALNIYNTLKLYGESNKKEIPTITRIMEYLGSDPNGNSTDRNASNILFNLNRSCELYWAYKTGEDNTQLESCLKSYQNLQLAPEFAESATTDGKKAEELDLLDLLDGKNIDDVSLEEFNNDLFNAYFNDLIIDINQTTNLMNTFRPTKLKDYTEESAYSDNSYLDQYFKGEYEDDYLDNLIHGEIPTSVTTQNKQVYQCVEKEREIPSDYALTNNIYMALSEYSKNNDDVNDLDYGDSDKFKLIYNKVQNLAQKEVYEAQSIIEIYAGFSKQNTEFDEDISKLYEYFLGSSNDKNFLNTERNFPNGVYFVEKSEGVDTSGTIENVAQRYFNHYNLFKEVETTNTIDTSNSEVQKAIAMYKLGNSYPNIEVVSEAIASDNEYVNNMVKNAAGVLLTFDTSKVAATEYTYITDKTEWSESEKEVQKQKHLREVSDKISELTTIEDVDVATSIYLEEVFDSSKANEAQAIYESEMAKINVKETRIDTELTELEAERQAIKSAQDSTKQVVKDNVNMAFKLFS